MKKIIEEKTIKTEKIYDGRIISVKVDTVELPNQGYAKREIVEHGRGVGIIAVNNENEMYFVKQFRKPVDQVVLEIPAGLVDPNEDIKEAAIRELQEEIGFKPNSIELITEAFASPGFTDEKISIFYATDLVESKLPLDDTEFLEPVKIDIKKAFEMVENFEINDCKTIIGILYAMREMENK